MRTLFALLIVMTLSACAITADRYKVSTISAWHGGNHNRVIECKDGYWRARDRRGTLWCVNENYTGTAFDFETLPRVPVCGDGEVLMVEKRPGGRSYCADRDSVGVDS